MHFLFESLPQFLMHGAWIGALVARLAVGLLFVISGFGKIAFAEKRQQMRETLQQAGVPGPGFNTVFVALMEFSCGALLTLGFLTPLACAILICIMLVALATLQAPEWQGSLSNWLGELLYLPEALYVVILFWLMLAGPGWMSVDYVIRKEAIAG